MQSKYSEAGDAKVGVWVLEKYEGDQVLGGGKASTSSRFRQ